VIQLRLKVVVTSQKAKETDMTATTHRDAIHPRVSVGMYRVQAAVAAGLLGLAGLAAAQLTPPAGPPRLMPTPTTPVAGSITSTVPGNTGTLVDPSGTTVPKITPAPEPRG
jgi:hypothetical protein